MSAAVPSSPALMSVKKLPPQRHWMSPEVVEETQLRREAGRKDVYFQMKGGGKYPAL